VAADAIGMRKDQNRVVNVEPCPVCDGTPRVLVVIQHPAMLRFTREILERECGCWVATEVRTGPALAAALDRLTPDLLVIDAADFPACCFAAFAHIPRDRVIVIGPEPDPAYRQVALGNGAAGWLSREDVGDELGSEMRRVLGCRHDPCPPGRHAHYRDRLEQRVEQDA
jgi:DNA-binding NarL/FixJ family response regulator